jgi:hypothetical protein
LQVPSNFSKVSIFPDILCWNYIFFEKFTCNNSFILTCITLSYLLYSGSNNLSLKYGSGWYRPDELFPSIDRYVDYVYNFQLRNNEENVIIIGEKDEYIACTLGEYCGERLSSLYPHNNIYHYKDNDCNQNSTR